MNFIQKFDHHLLTNYPRIWQSKVHYVFLFWIPYAILCILAGKGTTIDHQAYYSYQGTMMTTSIMFAFISVIASIIYLFLLTKYNYFKWYGKSDPGDSIVDFMLIFASFVMLNSGTTLYFMNVTFPEPVYSINSIARDFGWNTVFYWSLIAASLVHLYRHVNPRQFILGLIFYGVFLIFYWIFAALSSIGNIEAPIALLFFFAIISVVLCFTLPLNSSPVITVTLMIFYTTLLPFSLQILDGVSNEWSTRYTSFYKYSTFLLTILMIQFITSKVVRRQWGNAE